MNEVVREPAPEDTRLRVAGLVMSRKADGRANYSKPSKAALVEMVRSAVASRPVLARANGINANMLAKWVKDSSRSRVAKRAAAKPKLMPVVVGQSAAKPAVVLQPVPCEVVLVRGTLRMSLDAQGLRQVIDALSR